MCLLAPVVMVTVACERSLYSCESLCVSQGRNVVLLEEHERSRDLVVPSAIVSGYGGNQTPDLHQLLLRSGVADPYSEGPSALFQCFDRVSVDRRGSGSKDHFLAVSHRVRCSLRFGYGIGVVSFSTYHE